MANNPGLIKTYVASGGIARYRLVKLTADGTVSQAAAATDALMGVSVDLDVTDGERVDIVHTGLADVQYGGNVGCGDPLTSDAAGKAVAASPAAGANARIIGFAQRAGASGDIGAVLLSPCVMQG